MAITFNNSQAPQHQYVLPLLEKVMHVDSWKLDNPNSTDFFDLNIVVQEDIKVIEGASDTIENTNTVELDSTP